MTSHSFKFLCIATGFALSACSGETAAPDGAQSQNVSNDADANEVVSQARDPLTLASGAKLANKPNGLFNRNAPMEGDRAFSCVYDVMDAAYTMGPQDTHYASVTIDMASAAEGCLPYNADEIRPASIQLKSTAKTGTGITSIRNGFATTKLQTTALIDDVQAEFEMTCTMERDDVVHQMTCSGGMPVKNWIPEDAHGDEELRFQAGIDFAL